MIRFALFPGYIYSANDGDRHFISGPRLAKLYGVDLRECVVVDVGRPETCEGVDISRLLHLRPQNMAYPKVTPAERRAFPIPPHEKAPRQRVEPLHDNADITIMRSSDVASIVRDHDDLLVRRLKYRGQDDGLSDLFGDR